MSTRTIQLSVIGTTFLAALMLAGCGGGGGGSTGTTASGSSSTGSGSSGSTSSGGGSGSGSSGSTGGTPYVPGQYPVSTQFAAKCAGPRSGTDPVTGVPYPDVQGTATDENNFLRSWTHELYLWFDQVPDLNPSLYTTTNYFPLLKTSATTASGAMVDKIQFHFTYSTTTWESLSMNGVEAGYGVQFNLSSPTPPRRLVVANVDPHATGAAATLARGAVVQAIDGTDINAGDTTGVAVLNAGLQPARVGETHSFTVLDLGASTPRTVILTAANVTETPVPVATTLNTNSGKVGYILFNDHIATSESELISAFTTLQQQGVSDLVLDIRYNGGGFLDIASEVAFMIAGPTQSSGHTFQLQQFNSQHPTINPVTGGAITPTLFHNTSQGFSVPTGQALPSLNLARVFVLTGAQTCSASEAIMNGLRGVNVQVIQIGSTTCGKPYGFYPQPNCGTTYFSIEFRGVNDQNFGDYTDGFSPANTVTTAGYPIPGCSVADDFNHALGDPNEGQLSAALAYRTGGICTVAPSGKDIVRVKEEIRPELEVTVRSPIREISILRQ
jgi:carboxyl-terminal processing protease